MSRAVADAPGPHTDGRVKGCDAGTLDGSGQCTFVGTLVSCFDIFGTEQELISVEEKHGSKSSF